jgi:hypothetical protein
MSLFTSNLLRVICILVMTYIRYLFICTYSAKEHSILPLLFTDAKKLSIVLKGKFHLFWFYRYSSSFCIIVVNIEEEGIIQNILDVQNPL